MIRTKTEHRIRIITKRYKRTIKTDFGLRYLIPVLAQMAMKVMISLGVFGATTSSCFVNIPLGNRRKYRKRIIQK